MFVEEHENTVNVINVKNITAKETSMSIAKNIEISSTSTKSFDHAIQDGIKRVGKTVKNVQGAWIKEQKVVVEKGEIVKYNVQMIVSFIIKK